MNSRDTGSSEVTKWDPQLTERVMGWIRPIIKGYHRSQVRGERAEYVVAGLVAAGVVDLLEVVDVERHQRAAGREPSERVLERALVEEPGERVGVGGVAQCRQRVEP